jgi:N-formylglutamate deformylase
MNDVYKIHRPTIAPLPLIFDSPHSGSIYPEDFGHAIDRMTLRRSEDAHVEELFSSVIDHGATLLHALFPRSYIDPNRNEDDIDVTMFDAVWPHAINPTSKTLDRGVGLIWKDMKALGPIYDRKLTVAEISGRIEGYWRPYHKALADLIDAAHASNGRVVHIDCHSMASMGDRTTEDGSVPRPDFVVSDREGATCNPAVLDCVVDHLRGGGFTVSVNDPYKGFELVRRHGKPDQGRHSLQIEINRALYMEEETLSKTPNFVKMQQILSNLAGDLAVQVERL